MDRCSNPALGSAILSRRKDFEQAATVKQFIGIFGSNVLQVLFTFPPLKSVYKLMMYSPTAKIGMMTYCSKRMYC